MDDYQSLVDMSGPRQRVAVYNLYWSTMGGGEQVDGTIAQVLAEQPERFSVTILGPQLPDCQLIYERLGVDLSACDFLQVGDDSEASEASRNFDIFVNGTYLSKAINHSSLGFYYAHFPGLVPDRRSIARHSLSKAVMQILNIFHRLPPKLVKVREACERRVVDTSFVRSYHQVWANSEFTAKWVTGLWGVPCQVLYPPVRNLARPVSKRPLVLVLGRFFDPKFGHSKKQLELLNIFKDMCDEDELVGWTLAFVGGCDAANREYLLRIRRLAEGYPVEVFFNAPGHVVSDVLSRASLLWHGSGLGEDEKRHPERFEHFGIAVVEAMAAGVVPVVFGAAGPAEIVQQGINGWQWSTTEELRRRTREMAASPDALLTMSEAAQRRARTFSTKVFGQKMLTLVDDVASASAAESTTPDDV